MADKLTVQEEAAAYSINAFATLAIIAAASTDDVSADVARGAVEKAPYAVAALGRAVAAGWVEQALESVEGEE